MPFNFFYNIEVPKSENSGFFFKKRSWILRAFQVIGYILGLLSLNNLNMLYIFQIKIFNYTRLSYNISTAKENYI